MDTGKKGKAFGITITWDIKMLRLNECDLLFGHCLQAFPYHGMDRPDSLQCSHPNQKQPNRLHREQICIELHTHF